MSATKDLTGQTFGRLVVLARAGSDPAQNALWRCACSCPARNETVAATRQLKCGDTKSCGCLRGRPGGITPPPPPRPSRSQAARAQAARQAPVKDPVGAFPPPVCLAPGDALTPPGAVRRRVDRMLRRYGAGRY